MAPPKITATAPPASPTPGPSTDAVRNRIAEALHSWCQTNFDFGYVFSQDELLDAGIIPNKDIRILLSAVQHLTGQNLFKVHDRTGGTIGWELVDQERANNYAGLTRDERLVLQCIDGAKSTGIWTRLIKIRTALHVKVLDRVYKNLEAKGLIRSMKHVNHPSRKMYILAGLEPSEEATGGAWFSEGRLDVGLVDTISQVIEHYVSTNSWQLVEQDLSEESAPSVGQKRKSPNDDFEDHGDKRAKAVKTNDGKHKVKDPKQSSSKSYQPHKAGHNSYPTLRDITRHILNIKVTATSLPQNAISQLLQVMVYDDRLFKMHRPPNDDETPDDLINNTVTMYRCFKTPTDLYEQHQLEKRKVSHHDSVRKAAYRQQELEDLGSGGASEVPCMRCPVFDICGDGGPVNVVTCKYFDQWYINLAQADNEDGDGQQGAKGTEKCKHKQDKGKEKAKDQLLTVNGHPGPEVEVELDP